ncbi:O-methyltransferase [Virgisporangium aurantiacum]|uniref:Transferase n=1 Tax=Virgisporangium aurantiacum TaxID=175570 RepID=A0A8J4DZM5_9ACTN|nr:class I SAM-dependent methyltransferase [Virgisporangium aurantiacum]GIJ56890.1 transferase [Virgisporangium aurantiacum]
MSYGGTAAHRRALGIPDSVLSAVGLAEGMEFEESCLPEQGRLLALLAAGVGAGSIGETGTGCGVGLAWMAHAAHPSARLTSVDRDERRVQAVREVFARRDTGPRVEVLHGEWRALAAHAPFDLLVLDGGGHGKTGGDLIDLDQWVRPGGMVVIDDFTPFGEWPPRHGRSVDSARLHWLQHDRLLATEIVLTPSVATIVGRYLGPDRRRDRST